MVFTDSIPVEFPLPHVFTGIGIDGLERGEGKRIEIVGPYGPDPHALRRIFGLVVKVSYGLVDTLLWDNRCHDLIL
jgi:hypothetical protein